MSAVDSQGRRAIEVRPERGAPVRSLRVRWTLSLSALLKAGRQHGPELARALERWGAGAPDPTLEWTIEEVPGARGSAWTAAAALKGPECAAALFSPNGRTSVEVIEDAATSTRHAVVREGGEVLLSAVFDCAGEVALYAYTSLLAALGLAGGRYEVVR